MTKKQAVLAAFGLTAGILMTGCGQQTSEWKANENSIFVTRAQEVQSALVYTSEQDNDLYQQEELAEFVREAIEEEIAAFNSNGEVSIITEEMQKNPPVTLVSCTLEGRTGTLIFDYSEAQYYGPFAELTGDNTNSIRNLTVCSGADTESSGILSGAGITKANGKAAKAEDIAGRDEYVIVAFEGAGTICTEGKIAYISENTGVSLRDDFTAVTGEGTHFIIFK